MLVLSRREGESIIINDDITITVLTIKHNFARIGIEAPFDIPVHRKEIYNKIKLEELENNRNKIIRVYQR